MMSIRLLNDKLNEAAYIRAMEIGEHFEHERPDRRIWYTILKEVGYNSSTIGKNIAIATGFSVSDVVNAWMDSLGHRANILNDSFTELGVGYFHGRWVQNFEKSN